MAVSGVEMEVLEERLLIFGKGNRVGQSQMLVAIVEHCFVLLLHVLLCVSSTHTRGHLMKRRRCLK